MERIDLRCGLKSLSYEEVLQWQRLFVSCFGSNEAKAAAIFEKYRLHADDAWFCLGYHGTDLVACYAGILRKVGGDTIFISTDTMSNGVIKGATQKLGALLYERLKAEGVMAVCGFPNKNIVAIRERKLGWRMIGALHIYVAPAVLWRWRFKANPKAQQWEITRPASGFFGTPLPLTQILGRSLLYKRGWYLPLVMTASARRPGPFYLEIPHKLVQPKVFGFVALNGQAAYVERRMSCLAVDLDIQSIDVP
jgi:hypothetical protein